MFIFLFDFPDGLTLGSAPLKKEKKAPGEKLSALVPGSRERRVWNSLRQFGKPKIAYWFHRRKVPKNLAGLSRSNSGRRPWASRKARASVHNRRRQEFEVGDLELAAFIDENDLEIEIRIEILALLQVFDADSLCRRYSFKFLR